MDKDQLNRLIGQYSESSSEDAQEVLKLKQAYPYSQLLHALSARLTKDHGFSNHQDELQQAAVYAADRSVLREVMTKVLELAGESNFRKYAATSVTDKVADTSDSTGDLATEVIDDLKRLHELKHNFEALFSETPQPPLKLEEKEEKEPKPSEQTLSGKTKRERIIELANALQEQENTTIEASDVNTKKSSGRKKKLENPGDDLIEEIEFTKTQIEPESEKQKEQLEIIDQFIKAHPSISNPRERQSVVTGDLSTIKSGEFGDNIVSETLVDILIKQGKKDKAVEVLKKLIWKFPQKKAYFAAQIEELKK